MDWRRASALLASAALAATAAGLVLRAQPTAPPSSSPPPPAGSGAGSSGADQSSGQATPPGVPIIQVPPENAGPQDQGASDNDTDTDNDQDRAEKASTNKAAAAPPPPAPPPLPLRSPIAVIQVLDKITAETMRFAAPVGQRVRYKNVVFAVKTCETSGVGDPDPQTSAYLTVDFVPVAAENLAASPPKRVFSGWMFADSPGLNPLQHPIYDAWLIACTDSAPPA